MSRQWWPTNKKYFFLWLLHFVFVLNALVLWVWANLKCSNVFIQVRNSCFTSTTHLALLDIRFVLKVKLVQYFFANSPLCILAFWFNVKYIFVSLCKYSKTLRIKLLTWCRVVSQAGLFGSGRARALSLSKYFGVISGLHIKRILRH